MLTYSTKHHVLVQDTLRGASVVPECRRGRTRRGQDAALRALGVLDW